ncbi:WhiB family transcriptional regulator [Streptomyces sp. NPDC057445]|uniref:WhiB family transcriptional regulator n=1 Tax=Streptomyces sp. NPDC057445 TaxID=3346136 RepID=UPI0036BCFF99
MTRAAEDCSSSPSSSSDGERDTATGARRSGRSRHCPPDGRRPARPVRQPSDLRRKCRPSPLSVLGTSRQDGFFTFLCRTGRADARIEGRIRKAVRAPAPNAQRRSGGSLMSLAVSVRLADPRIPFPHTDNPPACSTDPERFVHGHGENGPKVQEQLDAARALCSTCPVVQDCLRWALANPSLTPTGIWAATTARQRNVLRARLSGRLGEDWVATVAEEVRRERYELGGRRLRHTDRQNAVAA